MELTKPKDLTANHWILFEGHWWKVDKVEDTDIAENMVIIHMHIPKEHFPDRAAPVQEFNLWASMMVPKNFELEIRKDL